MTQYFLSVTFDPLLPALWIWAMAIALGALLALSVWKAPHLAPARALCGALLLLTLLNPALVEEEREPLKDIVFAVIDRSASQTLGDRQSQTDNALAYIRQEIAEKPGLELRTLEAPTGNDEREQETLLFSALESAMADTPPERIAGTILISDGQIHDIPSPENWKNGKAPLHLLLTGAKDEQDRQIEITKAPAYGMTGEDITVQFKVTDTDKNAEEIVSVTVTGHADKPEVLFVEPGEEQTLLLPIKHPGSNIFNLRVEAGENELTPLNNQAFLDVQGVRARLKVLLVSGQPHAGTRTWRDLLKSDPSVDLVHFTILRRPDKFDPAHPDDLALIAFPFRELFEVKLYDFDLIIFDRYQLNRVLPDYYFENIADYVRSGGAFLLSTGPEFIGKNSIFNTALADILPAAPSGALLDRPFTPALTEAGKIHPVTQNLEDGEWGPWARQIGLEKPEGDILMSGHSGAPLLILNRVQEGRVAHIASDQAWLWQRGVEGGGPHAALLKRIVHWLMKEPELDENAFSTRVDGKKIILTQRSLKGGDITITATRPDGKKMPVTLTKGENGVLEATIVADQNGVWAFAQAGDEQGTHYTWVGPKQSKEYKSILATDQLARPLIDSTDGAIIELAETPRPALHHNAGRTLYAGQNWLGLRHTGTFTVSGHKQTPLLPAAALLALALLAAISMWRWEGKN